MHPDRRAFLIELVRKANAAPVEDREAFLARACAGDPELRADLDRLFFEAEGDELVSMGGGVDDAGSSAPSLARTLVGRPEPPNFDLATTVTDRSSPRLTRSCPACRTAFTRDVQLCPHDGEPLESDPALLVGTTLDGLYHVESLVGSGGMGTVFRARHVLLGDTVAIKMLPDSASGNAIWLRRFLREGQAARRFRHPNAVVVHDLRVSSEGPVYLVLEYVDGVSLRAELRRRRRFSPLDALAILEQIAGALDAAHRAGVVHRDLKPENVMLTTIDGALVAKVVDLGLARLDDGHSELTGSLTQAGTILGTPRYMSPEQWGRPQRDGSDAIDGRTDVYSLAVTAFELLAGQAPFDAKSTYRLRDLHIGALPPMLNAVKPDIAESVARAVDSGLAKDRADRPQTPGALVALLRQAIAPSTRSLHTGSLRSRADNRTTANLTVIDEAATDGWNLATVAAGNETSELPPASLPPESTSYIGGRSQIDAICECQPSGRVLTLVGAGGIGKTRLALQVARVRRDAYPHGVFFVDLAAVTDPQLTAATVAAAVGVAEQPGRPFLDVLRAELAGSSMLVVLDNCEHLREASATVVGALVESCPAVHVLATSREPLGLASERLWTVAPLATPDVAAGASFRDLAAVESVALFVERARAQRPGFAVTADNAQAIAALCVRLDGLPLAIELAAARCGVLTPAQILERLAGRLDLLATRQSGVPSRQRTLRASIDWSVQLLEHDVRRALSSLSVFRGGWTLEAAERVAEGAVDLVDVHERLCESSLIVADDDGVAIRFRMLEMIREYADEQLGDDERRSLRCRHASWITDIVAAAGLSDRNEKPEWLVRLDSEIANIRAAIAFGQTGEADPETAVRLVAGILPYWAFRGQLREGRAATDASLHAHPGVGGASRAAALNGLSMIAVIQSEPDVAHRFAAEALDIYQTLGDERGAADSLERLARVAIVTADFQEARAHSEASAAIWSRLGDEARLGSMRVTFGWISQELGEFERSKAELVSAAEALRRADNRRGIAVTMVILGETLHHLGDYVGAIECLRECETIATELGHLFLVASAAHAIGVVERDTSELESGEAAANRLDVAEAAADRAVTMNRELAIPDSLGASLVLRGSIALRRGDVAGAADMVREGTRMRYESAGRRGAALGLEAVSDVLSATGEFARSARLLGAADSERQAVGMARSIVERRQTAHREARLRAELGDLESSAHRDAGRALGLAAAIAEALGDYGDVHGPVT
ncbi:MAG: protein kinase [Blastocatellia bacterium]|nr:protein kinase [Blastocatellia bacterium]